MEVGKVYYFGYRKIPNTVTKIEFLENHNQFKARIELVGPRGGKSTAFVRHDGTVRKV